MRQNGPTRSTARSTIACCANYFADWAAQLAIVDDFSGLVFAPGGRPRVVVDFVLENRRIVEITLIGEPARMAALELKF